MNHLTVHDAKQGVTVKNHSAYSDWVEFEDPKDEYDDYGGFVLNVPKRSSIRRSKRLRAREFVPDINLRGRRKYDRQSIRTDLRFWEDK